MLKYIKEFLSPAEGSVKGVVQKAEVVRTSILSVVTGGTVWAILSILWSLVQSVVTDPNFAANFKYFVDLLNDKNYLALSVSIGTFVIDFIRRKYVHGQ